MEKRMEEAKNNLELWDRVSKTNPFNTKKVDYGRQFTAIDAMYQIQQATKEFGVAGKGWGWSLSEPYFSKENETVSIKCTLWHKEKANSVEHYGVCGMFTGKAGNKRPDIDCCKKAATDGLTKCLSYLGFNADVFLGKFDDNKYVEELKKEFKKEEKKEPKKELTPEQKLKAAADFTDAYMKKLLDAKDQRDLDSLNYSPYAGTKYTCEFMLKKLKSSQPNLHKKIEGDITEKTKQWLKESK